MTRFLLPVLLIAGAALLVGGPIVLVLAGTPLGGRLAARSRTAADRLRRIARRLPLRR